MGRNDPENGGSRTGSRNEGRSGLPSEESLKRLFGGGLIFVPDENGSNRPGGLIIVFGFDHGLGYGVCIIEEKGENWRPLGGAWGGSPKVAINSLELPQRTIVVSAIQETMNSS